MKISTFTALTIYLGATQVYAAPVITCSWSASAYVAEKTSYSTNAGGLEACNQDATVAYNIEQPEGAPFKATAQLHSSVSQQGNTYIFESSGTSDAPINSILYNGAFTWANILIRSSDPLFYRVTASSTGSTWNLYTQGGYFIKFNDSNNNSFSLGNEKTIQREYIPARPQNNPVFEPDFRYQGTSYTAEGILASIGNSELNTLSLQAFAGSQVYGWDEFSSSEYSSWNYRLEVTTVPLPAGVWFLLSGFGGFIGVFLRKQSKAAPNL